MLRRPLLPLAAAVLAAAAASTASTAAAAAAAASTGAAGSPPPRAALRGFACQTAVAPAARQVSVTAVMRPVAGTVALGLRFELLTRTARGGAYTPVHAGDLGAWVAPSDPPSLGRRPGDVWVVSKPVANLAAPATYRFRVTFRWTGTGGRTVRVATLQSRTCSQSELRPNLRVAQIELAPVDGHPRQNRYSVLLENVGATAAAPFDVEFAPGDGRDVLTRRIARLGAHATRRVTFTGRACTPADAPLVIADPADAVDDPDPSDNRLQVPATCPATTVQSRPAETAVVARYPG